MRNGTETADSVVMRTATARLPTEFGQFTASSFDAPADGVTHVALHMGPLHTDEPALVRVHSECMTGDIFASVKCDCGPQLHEAMRLIADAGRGAVVYLRGHEGRGIGIGNKLRAYELQDLGHDTVDANTALGLPVDARRYDAAAAIITALGIGRVRLLTNNPRKHEGLRAHGVVVAERVPLITPTSDEAARYLSVKRDRLGHLLPPDGGLEAP